MKITKLGHCCLIIETKGLRIMTDPGNFSVLQNQEKNIDTILITHEHADHLHVESLKIVLENNPHAQIITNKSVGALLLKESISFILVDDKKEIIQNGILFQGYGSTHQEIYGEFGQVENTGYFIDSTLFYPGDSFFNPGVPVSILALPVAGPWVKIKEAIDYALLLKPKHVFPVHDGMLEKSRVGGAHKVPQLILEKEGISFTPLSEGDTCEF